MPLPAKVLAALAAITVAYVAAAEAGERLFCRAIERPALSLPPAGTHAGSCAIRERGGTPDFR